jgi:hypothetical protein
MNPNSGNTETDISHTPAQSQVDPAQSSITAGKTSKVGRPSRKESSPSTWSIRGVERDTRAIIEKGAERSGKTIGQYINEEVRAFVQGQLTNNSQLPTSPKDIQNQINHLTQMVEGIANRLPEQGKRSLWKRLFG